MHKKRLIYACFAILAGTVFSFASARPDFDVIEKNSAAMTCEQTVGQTIMPKLYVGQQSYLEDSVKKGHITGVFLKSLDGFINTVVFSPEEQAAYVARQRALTARTISDLRKWEKESPHKIPLLIALDYEGGPVTSTMYLGLKQIPSNMLIAAAGDKKLAEKFYRVLAKEIKSLDAQILFGPVADVNTNPANPIIGARSFGSSSENVAAFADAAVRGLQKGGVAAFAKHFPGHGDVDTDSHVGVPVFGGDFKTHIAPFESVIKQGIDGILTNHVLYPETDSKIASLSDKITTDILRNRLGFKGVIATDDLGMGGAMTSNTLTDVFAKASAAGADLFLISGDAKDTGAYKYPETAVKFLSDKCEVLKDSAARILELKRKTGLLPVSSGAKSYNTAEFYSVVRKIAQKGVTLVRNSGGVLPLRQDTKNICTIFFADSIFGEQLRTFNSRLINKGKNVVSYTSALTPSAEDEAAALDCARGKDIVVIGSMQRYVPYAGQRELVNKIMEASGKTVLISLLSPYDISSYPQAATVLAVYGPTKETMRTAAEIVLGERKARGKMPVELK